MFMEASWLSDDVLDCKNMYARSESVGDINMLVGLYGNDCPVANMAKRKEDRVVVIRPILRFSLSSDTAHS